jgi:hypothetical protein
MRSELPLNLSLVVFLLRQSLGVWELPRAKRAGKRFFHDRAYIRSEITGKLPKQYAFFIFGWHRLANCILEFFIYNPREIIQRLTTSVNFLSLFFAKEAHESR